MFETGIFYFKKMVTKRMYCNTTNLKLYVPLLYNRIGQKKVGKCPGTDHQPHLRNRVIYLYPGVH